MILITSYNVLFYALSYKTSNLHEVNRFNKKDKYGIEIHPITKNNEPVMITTSHSWEHKLLYMANW